MAAWYTTPDLVRGVVEQDQAAWPDLTPFIEAAHLLVERHCLDSGYPDTQLQQIATWLAAHCYATADMRAFQEIAGGTGSSVQQTLQSRVDFGLRLTHYGQMAMRIDDDGNLAALDNALNKVTKMLPGSRTPRVGYLGQKPPTCRRW